jgi:hypothetical protein
MAPERGEVMYGLQTAKAEFTDGDFRRYNPAGYDDLVVAATAAQRRAEVAGSAEEKELARTHLASVEQLWRLARELAKERFEHARDTALDALQAATETLRCAGPAAAHEALHEALRAAEEAYHGKDFAGAEGFAAEVKRGLEAGRGALRLVPAVRVAAPESDVVELLEKALEHERNHRMGQACRMYLQVLRREPANLGAQQRLRTLRGRTGGHV